MKYFKNTELARIYHISEKSVRNWIDATQKGKLDLDLYIHNERSYVANNAKNHHTITQLVAKGQKYKNSRGHKVIAPTASFMQRLPKEFLMQLAIALDTHNEIPFLFHRFFSTPKEDEISSYAAETTELLNESLPAIRRHMNDTTIINAVCIGYRSYLIAQPMLAALEKQGIRSIITCLDLHTPELQALCSARGLMLYNFNAQYDNPAQTAQTEHDQPTVYLALDDHIAALTHPNLALQQLSASLRAQDICLYASQAATPAIKHDFAQSDYSLATLNALGITPQFYTMTHTFTPETHTRQATIRLQSDITFQLSEDISYSFAKDTSLTIWRRLHETTAQAYTRLTEQGLEVVELTHSATRNTFLAVLQTPLR